MNKKLKILILEDTPADVELVQRELRKAKIDFTSRVVDTKEAFLKELKDFSPDIILSDYNMPQFTGMEALRLKKEIAPSLPLIIVTGSINEETAVECIKEGAADYLVKESLRRLGPAVLAAIERKKAREEKEQMVQVLQNTARGVSSKTGEAFFNSLVQYLTKILQTEYAVVAKLSGSANDHLTTVALCNGEKIADNITYSLKGTPCEHVIAGDTAVYSGNLQQKFPEVKMFEEMEAQSYIGAPLYDSKENPIGVLAVLHNKPLSESRLETIKSIVEIFSTRASAEIERLQTEENLKKSEEQFRQSQKMESIGKLAGGVAHDFNNVLTAIMGYVELSLATLKPEDPLYNNIMEIKNAGEKAATLTRQLLAFSRKQVLELKVINLNALIADVEKMLKQLIGEDIEIKIVQGTNLDQVKADPGQMEQVIMNLAVNARDAMPNGGTLIIETANANVTENFTGVQSQAPVKTGPHVMIAISDTGCGISKEVQAQIFEPFYTTKEKGKGTGLGLSTVYGIVKQSKGIIHVYSEPGKGTTFKIYLPKANSG